MDTIQKLLGMGWCGRRREKGEINFLKCRKILHWKFPSTGNSYFQ